MIADETGCCYMNFFNDVGKTLEEGDILYVNGVYSSFYKEMLIIYQGSCSIIRRIGKWYMKFNLINNISTKPTLNQQNLGSNDNWYWFFMILSFCFILEWQWVSHSIYINEKSLRGINDTKSSSKCEVYAIISPRYNKI